MNVKMREIQSIHFDQIKYRDFNFKDANREYKTGFKPPLK